MWLSPTNDWGLDMNPLPCQVMVEGDIWFSIRPKEVALAQSLCQECPIKAECLAGALKRRESCGVWGGEFFKGGQPGRCLSPGRPRKTP